MAIATALVILLLAAPAVYGVQHTVGDTSGWDSNVDYVTWAASKTFTVGDTLCKLFLTFSLLVRSIQLKLKSIFVLFLGFRE